MKPLSNQWRRRPKSSSGSNESCVPQATETPNNELPEGLLKCPDFLEGRPRIPGTHSRGQNQEIVRRPPELTHAHASTVESRTVQKGSPGKSPLSWIQNPVLLQRNTLTGRWVVVGREGGCGVGWSGERREGGGEGRGERRVEEGGVVVVVVVRTECCTCMSVHTRTRVQPVKMNQCQTPCACSLRRQGSRRPWCKTHPTPMRGKRLRGTPTSPPSLTEKGEGGAIFSIFSALDALDPEYHEKMHLDESSWTRFTLLPPSTAGRPGVTSHLLPLPFPTLGKDHGEKRMVKIVVQCRSFNVPSRSSEPEPLG